MPRKPKQQQLVVPPGADPATYVGTPEAKAKMEKVRAAKAAHAMQRAADALAPGQLPRIEANPMVIATECLGALNDMADVLQAAGISGGLAKAQVVGLLIKGLELGVGPVEAVQGLYFTGDGKIETNAELVRALVLRHRVGRMTPVALTDTECVIEAVRYGVDGRADQLVPFTYTMGDAQRAGYLDGAGADMWRRHPRAMLLARCTTEAGRAMFSDVLLGASFAAGELGSGRSLPARDLVAAGDQPDDLPGPEPTPGPAVDAPGEAPPPLPDPEPEAEPIPDEAPEAPPTPAEAPTAPPEPEVSPEPTPEPEPGSPVTAGNGSVQEGGRTFSHSFVVPGLNGGLRTVETCGITRAQFQALGDITTPRAGQPEWRKLQDYGRRWLTELGLADLKELSEPEATQLIEYLVRQAEYVRPEGNRSITVESTLPSRAVLLEGLLRDNGIEHLLPKVVQLIQATFKTQDLDQIARPDFDKGLAEIRNLASDPIVFEMMIEQVLAQQP